MSIEINKPSLPISVTKSKTIDDTKYIPKPYLEVAEGMEREFANIMMKQMNKTVGEAQAPSTGMGYYKGLLDDKRVNSMVKSNGGLGLQKLILDQIYPKRMRNEFAYNHYKRQQEQGLRRNENINMHSAIDKLSVDIHQEGEDE